MANADWRRQTELKKIEQLERKLEAEELLREEEVRLISASQQIRNVKAKLEETRAELSVLEHSQQLVRNIEITEADEADLAREFSLSIYRVLDGLRTTSAAELDTGTAAGDGEGGGGKEGDGEEQGDDGYGGYDNYDDYYAYYSKYAKSKSARGDSAESSNGSDEAGEEAGGPGAAKPTTVDWITVQWCRPPDVERVDAEVTVRINDVYTFAELRADVCSHLGLPCDEESLDALEIATPGARAAWSDSGVVLAEIRKGALMGSEQGDPPIVRMRPVPPSVLMAESLEQEQEEEREVRDDVSRKAESARRSAHYLRTIALARKRSRHARSLIFRGIVHFTFTVLFAISISYGTTRGFETVDAVRTALAKQRFSSQPDWMGALTCAQIEEGSALSTPPVTVGLPAATPHLGLRLEDVKTPEGVEAWLRGALMDALAPRCSYDGRPVSYAPNASGSIGFYHNMITPLRLQQTRFSKSPGCDSTLSVQNYPNLAHRGAQRDPNYPACGSIYTRGAEPFGDQASAGFTYTPTSAFTGVGGASPRYEYAGTYGSYGPDGYIRDVWAAADYRSTIDSLLAAGWIDGWTESVAAHLQLVNAQTGCLILATALFEFSPAGGVLPQLSLHDMCEPDGAPKLSADFSKLFAFDYYSFFEIFVYLLCGLYVLRVCFVQYKAWKRMRADVEGRTLYHFTGMAYVQDTALGLVLFVYLIFVIVLWERQDAFCELLWSMRYTTMPAPLRERMQQIIDSLVSGTAASTYSTESLTVALSSLKHAFYMSVPWDGTPWGFEVLDMHWGDPTFVSFLPNANTAINLRGLRAVLLLMVVLKAMRYAQAWRPLASRYAGIAQNLSYITRFFLLLLHFHLCFSLQAHLVFGQDLVEFQSVTSSFMQLLFLLTGKITVANALIALDTKSGSFVGQLFLLLFMIVLVLSGSSLIISILAEGWSNATEVLRRRRETKQRLRALNRFSRQAEELELLKQSTLELSEEELVALADEADQIADQAAQTQHKISRLKRMRTRLAQTAFLVARNSRMTPKRMKELDSEDEAIGKSEERAEAEVRSLDVKFSQLATKLAASGMQGSAVAAMATATAKEAAAATATAVKEVDEMSRDARRTIRSSVGRLSMRPWRRGGGAPAAAKGGSGGIALASAPSPAATSGTRRGAGAPAPAEATQATEDGAHESPTQETTVLQKAAAGISRMSQAVAAELNDTFRTDSEGDFDRLGRMPTSSSTEELVDLSRTEAEIASREAEDDLAYEARMYDERPLRDRERAI